MLRHVPWLLCALLLLPAGCDEAKKTSGNAPAKTAAAPPARPAKAPPRVTAMHPPKVKSEAGPAGPAEALADVLGRYAKLEGVEEGTEPHVFGLTMHRLTVRPIKDTPVAVRIGEEGGLVGAHEVRALFGDETAAKRVIEGLPKLAAAALGKAGHHDNAVALARQAMADLNAEGCTAARLGPFQLIAAYKPQGTARQHELSLLIGDSRAKGPGSRKLLGMLGARARTCGGIRAAK